MSAIIDSPGLPKRGDTPVFNEPWEARAYAITLALHARGLFTESQWSEALARQMDIAQQRGDPDLEVNYYRHWLRALETLLGECGAIAADP